MAGLALLLARDAEARGPVAPRLRIQASPGRLTLGANPRADLRIETDPTVRDLRLLVTIGRVEGLAPVQPGVFRATYVPPEQRYPQIAILLAVANAPEGPVYGWAVLPLDGQGLAEVRSRPRATVTLKIGAQTFGPVRADASGVGRVPVVVPPGVQRGYFGGEVVELGLPPIPLVQAIAERDVVLADRPEEVRVWIFAVDPTGRPQPGDQIKVSVTRGSIEPLELVEPGALFTRWTLPPDEPGSVRLEGRVQGDPLQKFGVSLRAQAGPASAFELYLDRERVVAEADVRLGMEVRAKDARGKPARVAQALRAVSSLGGEPVPLAERGPGRYAGVLRVPSAFGGRDVLEVRILTEESAAPVAVRAVPLQPAAPARLEVVPLQESLVASGAQEAGYRVVVTDPFGNRVPGVRPVVAHTTDPVAAPVPLGLGEYLLRVTPRRLEEGRASALELRLGELAARSSFELRPARGWLSMAAKAGVVSNFGNLLAPGGGVELGLWPGVPARNLGLALEVSYLSFSRGGTAEIADFSGHNQLVKLFASIAFRAYPWEQGEAWLSAGPGLALVRVRSRFGGGLQVREATAAPAAQAALGVGHRLGPGLPFIEGRFVWSADPGLATLRGVLRGAGLQVGYRLELD